MFLNINICCEYSLEGSQCGVSNEYYNICFLLRNNENINTSWLKKSALSGAEVHVYMN